MSARTHVAAAASAWPCSSLAACSTGGSRPGRHGRPEQHRRQRERGPHRARRRLADRDLHRAGRASSRPSTPGSRSRWPSTPRRPWPSRRSRERPPTCWPPPTPAPCESAAEALAAAPEVFATNTLVLVVPAGNPAGIESASTTSSDEGIDYVACVETAPCGAVWAALAEQAGVEADAASLEVDVKAVLARVVADEVDAGVVYATDAVAAGDAVETLDLPGAEQQLTSYPLSACRADPASPTSPRTSSTWCSARSGAGVLTDAGFGVP